MTHVLRGVVAPSACAVALVVAPQSGAVEAWDQGGRALTRCDAIERLSPLDAIGGCVVIVSAKGLALSVTSAVGPFVFTTCGIDYTLRIDGHGKTVVSDVEFPGPSPCPDVEPCIHGAHRTVGTQHYVWQGRIVRDASGVFEHRIDACLDTCLGRFEGKLVMGIDAGHEGWRSRLVDGGAVGRSGWELGNASLRWIRPITGTTIGSGDPSTVKIRSKEADAHD